MSKAERKALEQYTRGEFNVADFEYHEDGSVTVTFSRHGEPPKRFRVKGLYTKREKLIREDEEIRGG